MKLGIPAGDQLRVDTNDARFVFDRQIVLGPIVDEDVVQSLASLSHVQGIDVNGNP